MRRGNLDKISIRLIILAGIFSLLSFALDQMVVQTEDKLREKELEYKQILFDLNNYSSINKTLQYTSKIIESKFSSLHFRNETSKQILGSFVDDSFADKFYQGLDEATPEQLKNFTKTMKELHKRDYLFLYDDYLIEIKGIKEILKYIVFSETELQKKYNEILKAIKIDFAQHYKNYNLNEYTDEYLNSYKKVNKIYFNLLSFNDVFLSVGNSIDDLKTETAKRWAKNGKKMEKIEEEIIKIQNLENNYILFSILCQILGLASLLILFRFLLKD